MAKFKWLIVGKDSQVEEIFSARGYDVGTLNVRNKGFDGVVFLGGEDVTPFLYGQAKHPSTSINLRRDLNETRFYRELPTQMPKVGICRGAQFLNVMSGGSMWQHVDNHGRPHTVLDTTSNRKFVVTSTHHQMMRPSDEGWIMLGADQSRNLWSDDTHFAYRPDGYDNEYDDVEAVYYGHSNSFCFQPHPEYSTATKDCRDWFFDTIESLFNKEIEKVTKPKIIQVG